MHFSTKCECCGHTSTAYTHKLGKNLVQALRQLVDWYEETKSPAHLQRHLNLTKTQYNNFQKLQYFNLVRNIPEGWLPTPLGIDFIYNRAMVLNTVATIENNVLSSLHGAWKTHKGKEPKLVSVRDIHLISYKTRSEYQLEKSRQLNLNR